jgi:hypothetical protein
MNFSLSMDKPKRKYRRPQPLKRNPLRPSSLDALFRCGWYLSEPRSRKSALRGLELDDYLRDFFDGKIDGTAVPAELQPVFWWGVKKTQEFSKGEKILVRKADCRVAIPGLDRPGTCDGVAPGALTSFDWKSGHRRSYARQMAAYAYGQMENRFAISWTCVILYLDEGETEFFRFSFEEARAIVEESRSVYDTPVAPVINESCGWCANFYRCPTQLAVAGRALQIAEDALWWPEILQDPERLSRFLLGVKALERFGKEGREKAREFFFQKTEVPGFILVNGKRSWALPVETLLLLLSKGDDIQVREALRIALGIQGDMSKENYFALCGKLGIQPDESLLVTNRGEPYVRAK